MSKVSVQTYRKKPLAVQALQWDGTDESLAEFIRDGLQTKPGSDPHGPLLKMKTETGTAILRPGDWVIKELYRPGEYREYTPCPADMFAHGFEPVRTGAIDPQEVRDKLLLVVTDETLVPALDVIELWSEASRTEAWEWAAAIQQITETDAGPLPIVPGILEMCGITNTVYGSTAENLNQRTPNLNQRTLVIEDEIPADGPDPAGPPAELAEPDLGDGYI